MSKKPEPTPTVHLAAFGKHPGWDDHIDDLGVETDRLALAKRQLYGEGVAGNIESGGWGRPQEDPPAGLIPFGHVFMWLVGPDVLVGRLWPSRDGKKPPRTNYPMVVCAQLVGLPPEWAVREVLPRLETLEARLTSVETQDEVREALDEMRSDLRAAAAGVVGDAASWRLDPVRLARLAERPEVEGSEGGPGVGLLRVLYEIEKEMGDFRSGGPRSRSRSRVMSARGLHVRVPACTDPGVATFGEPMLPWLGLLRAELESATPMLAIRPVGADGPMWVDLVAGDPTAGSLQCVRVSPEAVPLTTTIPYNIEPAFVAQCADRFAAWRAGRLPGFEADAEPAVGSASDGPVATDRARPRWLRWLGGAGAVIAVGGGALIALSGSPEPEPADPADPAAPLMPAVTPAPRPVKTAPKPVALTEAASSSSEPVASQPTVASTEPDSVAGLSMEKAKARLLARRRIVDDSEAVNAAWVRWRDELMDAAKDPRVMESDAASLRAGLVRLAESVPPPPRFWGDDADGLLVAARRERDRVLEEHLRQARPWRDGSWHEPDGAASPSWSERAAELPTWDNTLIDAAADMREAGRLLAAGSLPDEPSAADGPAARFARWEGTPFLAALQENAPALVRPVRDELARLADIAAAGDLSGIVALFGDADPTAPAARAAWRRLAQLPPATDAATLRGLVDLSARSGRAIAAAEDREHRDAWAAEARRAYVDRSIATLDGLSDADEIEAAAAMLAELRLDDADLARLSEPALYNLALASAKSAVRSLKPAADEQALRDRLRGFLEAADHLPAASASPAAAPVVAGVREALAAPGPESAALERLGPGSRGWKAEVLEGGQRVRYVWTPDAETSRSVEFALVRLAPQAQASPKLAYVSTEEVSFGLFVAALTAADGWELAKPLLRSWDPNLGRDPRLGPRVWDWKSDQRRTPPIRLADDWLARAAADEPSTDRPAEAHPMQHVSAPAAVLTARLLGCRVPTFEEWLAALEAEGGVDGVSSQSNRRDAAWRRYADAVPSADAGMFVPSDAPEGGSDSPDALALDDGVVWFRPAADGGGRTVRHLIGNVAELIALRPEEMEQAAATPEAAILAVGGDTPGVAVVGGSAMSPPSIAVDQPLPIGPRALREGRADLGFRLAFAVPQAPTEPLATRAGAWLEGAAYLPLGP